MKTILIDCDGVLLDWETDFVSFMDGKSHPLYNDKAYSLEEMFGINSSRAMSLCREFNNSAAMGFLRPIKGSVESIKELSAMGFSFHCITSMGTCQYAQRLRISNLDLVFGNVFSSLTFLDCGQDKEAELKKYANSNLFWIEDKPNNANVGALHGLQSILLTQTYNKDTYLDPRVTRCGDWNEITAFIKHESNRTP